jgi:hypothetical protein
MPCHKSVSKTPGPKIILIGGFHHRANVLLAISNYAVMKRLFHPRDHDGDHAHEPKLPALSGISDFAQAGS